MAAWTNWKDANGDDADESVRKAFCKIEADGKAVQGMPILAILRGGLSEKQEREYKRALRGKQDVFVACLAAPSQVARVNSKNSARQNWRAVKKKSARRKRCALRLG